jgi:hypothetical protein
MAPPAVVVEVFNPQSLVPRLLYSILITETLFACTETGSIFGESVDSEELSTLVSTAGVSHEHVCKEFCKVLFDEIPRREAIDSLLRELPTKMALAISDYLAAPSGCVV